MFGNLGPLERILRVVIGGALMAYGYYATGPWRWLALAGVVLAVTAFIRFCPIYWSLRLNGPGAKSCGPNCAPKSETLG